MGQPDPTDRRRWRTPWRLRLGAVTPTPGSSPSSSGLLVVLGLFGRALDRRTIALDLRTVPQLRVEAIVAGPTFAIGMITCFLAKGAFATRYAAVDLPVRGPAVAAGVTRFTARWIRFGALGVMCAILGVGALWNIADTRTQAAEFGAAIDANAQPGDLVVYCPDQLGPAGSRAVTADVEQVVYPTFEPRRASSTGSTTPTATTNRTRWRSPSGSCEEARPDRGIFVVWNGEYKTFDGDCEAMVNTIGGARPGQELVADKSAFFEHGSVSWFPANVVSRT